MLPSNFCSRHQGRHKSWLLQGALRIIGYSWCQTHAHCPDFITPDPDCCLLSSSDPGYSLPSLSGFLTLVLDPSLSSGAGSGHPFCAVCGKANRGRGLGWHKRVYIAKRFKESKANITIVEQKCCKVYGFWEILKKKFLRNLTHVFTLH